MPSGAVTVGGLVINLAAETSQLKTDMADGVRTVDTSAKAMINSMAGITESSDRATDAGARMVRQLKEEIATFGMSSEEILKYKANLNGVGGEVEALMSRLNSMKAAQAGFSDQLAASEAAATQRIREMVAASMSEVAALNEVATATQGVAGAQAGATRVSATWADAQRLQAQNMAGVAASMRAVQEGTVAMSADTQRILAQYDPLGAKLRALQADLATLRKEMGNSVDPATIKAFQGLEDEIAKTQALMARAAAQAAALGGSTSQLTLTQTQLIERFRDQAATIGMSRSQLMAYQAAQLGVTEQTKDAIAKVKAHEEAIKAAAKAKEEERNQANMMADALKLLSAGYAALKIGELIKDSAMLAARYETLDVVMGVVGRTAGYTKTQMEAAAEGVARQGITMTESRNSVVKLVQAHIDLANASALARIAQDAAVIGNINSSEAFERLVNGVARGNVLILRNIGINVNLQSAYDQMASSLGKSSRELTENERVQARLNAVLERGTDIAGTYEAAMDTASKQITSMKRYTEDLKTTLGEVFNETLTIGVMALTDGLRDANGNVSELAKNDQLEEWGHNLTTLFVGLANAIGNAGAAMSKVGIFAAHQVAEQGIKDKYKAQIAELNKKRGFFDLGPTPGVDRLIAARDAELAEENATYVAAQAEANQAFDRFERAAEERRAARLAKKKADADARLKVDQDYAARAAALLIANADKSVEVQQAAQVRLAKEVYQGTPTFRDTEGRESKPKVDQADNTRLQDRLARIQEEAAAEKQQTEQLMKLDDMRNKAGELSDAEFYANRRGYLEVLAQTETNMYDQQLAELRSHHNSTQAEEAKNQKAIHDIIGKQAASGNKAFYDQQTDDEQARLREKKLYDETVKATVSAGVASVKTLEDQIAKQKEHNAEIGKTKEQIELAKQAQVDLATAQLQSDADFLRDGLAKWQLDAKSMAVYKIRLASLDEEIAKRRALSGLLAAGADAEAGAKAAAELDKYLDPTRAREFGNALKGSLGTAARSMIDLTSAMQRYGREQAANEKERKNAEIARAAGTLTQAQYLKKVGELDARNTQQQLASYGNMASAAAGFFDEHSRGYQALTTMSQVFHAAELAMTMAELVPKAISAVLTQGQGDPYTAFGRMAAMGALVAGLGVAIGGIGGGNTTAKDRQAAQGTGTVLGDSSAKSNSISRAIELSASNSSTQIDYLSGMLQSLRTIESNIGSFASQVLRNGDITDPNVGSLNTNNGGATTVTKLVLGGLLGGPLITSLMPSFVNNFIGKVATSIFGGKQTLEDSGFTMSKASLAAILANGAKASSYADVKTSGGWFSSDKHDTKTTSLGIDANQQFTLILKSMADGISSAADLLGVAGSNFDMRLSSFVVDIGKVSLKGLTGEAQQKALEAVFSKLGDQMASYAIGGLQQFQKVGEGYLETLVRVASDYAKVEASLQSIGKTFGSTGLASIKAREDLIALMGGIDDFQKQTAGFASNFLTKQEQLAPVAKYVNEQLAKLGLTGITTRDQFKQVVLGLNLTTAAGQEEYAALMSLQDAFAATHAATVDLSKTEQEVADERKNLQDQLDQLTMTQTQLLSKQRDALDAANRPLFDMIQAAQKLADTSSSMAKFRDAAKSLGDSLVTGSLSTLTPEQQYQELRNQYEKTKSAAFAGDTKAQDAFSSSLTAFLTASQKLNSGDSQYQTDFAMAQQDSAAAASWASQQVDVAQAQLSVMNAQSVALNTTNTSLQTLVDTVKDLKAANDELKKEIAGLRADQQRQTGDTITTNVEGQQQAAATIVNGIGGIVSKLAIKSVKVALE